MMVGDPRGVMRWCLRVPVVNGETQRRILIDEGALDRSLKPRREGNDLLIPVTAWRDGAEEGFFFKLPERLVLPRHELIGGIAVMQEHDTAGAERILSSRQNLHTVLFATSEVEGEYRTRSFTVLAGTPTTRTQVTEHGHRFVIDLSSAYFSARLATERQRIASLTGTGEVVLDMFAGVGPFAIALADRAKLVVAADINPRAAELMLENIEQNRVKNVLLLLADARRFAGIFPWQFDRIVMNLPKKGESFLPEAFRLCRAGGTIHYYTLSARGGEHVDRIEQLGGRVVAERVVRSYSPAQWHGVYDILVTKAQGV